ncbi:MAG: family 20 glycosylhydrolase, partial [Clostridia bacterium]|nr:family 20 glycosylhydrolase [Clostridia bacterium]
IEDEPDFEYRGLYHDITRGKVAKVETLKKLIDDMAYFKMNSLQLYVEHTFEFEETKDLIENTGYLTKEEIKELDEYCCENFIDFIPYIATFGHMYEILEQDQYKHLRVLKDFKATPNFWLSRMRHHTIDPLDDESFELVKSLIEQYYPLFKTDRFNICGDETFDLENLGDGAQPGKLYVDFILKVINYMHSKNKKVMMWADILLKHPETLEVLPDDIYYLNWKYSKEPPEDSVVKLSEYGKKQIVCPGTSSWSRLCEDVDIEEGNITAMIDYGYKHGAVGVLNTNWGDYGNPASIELAMYGIVLGAVKSWTVDTVIDDAFYSSVNELLYGGKNAIEYIRRISRVHTLFGKNWNGFCCKYFEIRFSEEAAKQFDITIEKITEIQKECVDIIDDLSIQKWKYDTAREEAILCAEGICVLAQLGGKMLGIDVKTVIEPKVWMKKYSDKWLEKNKPSELSKIEEMIFYIDAM